jgi:hypothetical protein
MTMPPRQWPVLDTVSRWYRNWRAARDGVFELQCAGAAEVERIAQELGLSTFELRDLVSHPDDSELLSKRLSGLHLEPHALAVSDPCTYRDLQRVCTMCGFKYRCARDMAVDPARQDWQDYCPNAATLRAIGAIREAPDPASWE